MKSATKDKEYTSPVPKLARFFEQSRDQWKAKCREAKRMLKCLKSRNRFLQQSRDQWRQKAQRLAQELAEAQVTERELRAEVARLKAGNGSPPSESESQAEWAIVPYRHQYSVGHAALFIRLVLSDAASLRCAGRAMATLGTAWRGTATAPAWSTGRLWILRLGYYKLTRPKDPADDWVWIVDHTLQVGAEKCLVILGVRLSALPAVGHCLRHQDVEPIALLPVEQSNGEVVYHQLEAQVQKTGVPREIVSDHGTDLQAGIAQFCAAHRETAAIYDIKHKTAAVLKRELGQDPTWLAFAQQAHQTKRQVQQTALAALAPPGQRTKARYMNVDVLLAWGCQARAFLDNMEHEAGMFDPEQVRQKLGWVAAFRHPLAEWHALLQVVTTTESYIRQRGLYQGVHLELEAHLKPLAATEQAQQVMAELVAFVAQEAAKATPGERLLGSSEIIESVLGTQKRLEQDQAKSGFTGLLLALCAVVADTTTDVVRQALETVPTQKVLAWCRENLGQSVQAQRRTAFPSRGRKEQKWNQSWTPV
ncbi:MAG: hypothetical protein KKA73_25400 [Chloroflexi bacterium]|nr:hypothetical protein [Chloroflexota bacterium]MBU1751033.1 hypothetical protein [Chloroflexota bacterium]